MSGRIWMIGHEVKQLRAKKKLSQEKLARLSDVSYNTIVKIENNATKNPGVKTLSKIAKALDVSVDRLINEP